MTNHLENVPTEWTTADETFFSLARRIFDAAFLYGAGVLLASYDPAEPDDIRTAPVVGASAGVTRSAAPTCRRETARPTQ